MTLQGTLWAGLAGALLLFAGDMTLYYSKNDYTDLDSVIAIMRREPKARLYLGGLLGPTAAFLYCIGFYHTALFVLPAHGAAGRLCFLLNCLGIICGGAYHSLWPLYGTIGRLDQPQALQEVRAYATVQEYYAFGIQGVGFVLLAALVALGWTALPRWAALLTPGVLMLLTPALRRLPKGVHMVVCGGWTNLVSVIYYAAALLLL